MNIITFFDTYLFFVFFIIILISFLIIAYIWLSVKKEKILREKAFQLSSSTFDNKISEVKKSDENQEEITIDLNRDGKKNIFEGLITKKISKKIWEGRYVPFTFDNLNDDLKDSIRSHISEIPPLPTVANNLITAIAESGVSIKSITDLVAKDPVLAGKLLQLVNSSFYGVSKEVKSIGRAIVLLGFNTVKNFTLQNVIVKTLPKKDMNPFSIQDFWMHSLAVSSIAYHLARDTGISSAEISTISLLHDVGKLATTLWKPDEYPEYIKSIDENHDILPIMLEEKIFGFHHALVGGLLSENWGLPDEFSKSIMYHHHPVFIALDEIPIKLKKAIAIVHFANDCAKICDFKAENDVVIETRPEYYQLLGKSESLESLIDQNIALDLLKLKKFASL